MRFSKLIHRKCQKNFTFKSHTQIYSKQENFKFVGNSFMTKNFDAILAATTILMPLMRNGAKM